MVHSSKIAVLLGAVAVSASHDYLVNGEYDQDGQLRDATCDNNCFFKYFTNKCNADNPACDCTLPDMRAKYFCCMAENCLPYVVTDSIERLSNDCVAWKMPFGPFDVEAECGIKIAAETTSQSPAAQSTTEATAASASTASSASSASDAASAASGNTETKSVESTSANYASPSTTASAAGSSSAAASSESSKTATTSGAGATVSTAKDSAGSRAVVQGASILLALPALLASLL